MFHIYKVKMITKCQYNVIHDIYKNNNNWEEVDNVKNTPKCLCDRRPRWLHRHLKYSVCHQRHLGTFL